MKEWYFAHNHLITVISSIYLQTEYEIIILVRNSTGPLVDAHKITGSITENVTGY